MKPYQKSALRRRFRRKIKTVKRIIWLIVLVALIMYLVKLFVHQKVKATTNDVKVEVIQIVLLAPSPRAIPTPLSDKEMIKALPNGELVWKIYGHESTWGKFDSCKAKGLYNGFGYGQSKFGYRCFDSLKQVATHVSHWLTVHLQTETVAQALCEYNTGKITNTCNYERYTQNL